jgi:hypothetical protein
VQNVYKALPVDDTSAFIRQNKLCFKCFASGHFAGKCRSQGRETCNGRYHPLLHKVQHGRNNSIDDEVGSGTPVDAAATYFSVKGKTL